MTGCGKLRMRNLYWKATCLGCALFFIIALIGGNSKRRPGDYIRSYYSMGSLLLSDTTKRHTAEGSSELIEQSASHETATRPLTNRNYKISEFIEQSARHEIVSRTLTNRNDKIGEFIEQSASHESGTRPSTNRADKIGEFIEHPDKVDTDVEVTDASEFVAALNTTWLTWVEGKSRAIYRACVNRPPADSMRDVLTGGRVMGSSWKSAHMTIETCVNTCIERVFTYAGLSRGSECYCSNVTSSSTLLTYMDSALCDKPCTGDILHNCGGEDFVSVYRTIIPDDRCSHIKLGEFGEFPLVALGSFPRSGNTWARLLIEHASGINTGSIYWENEMMNFPGTKVDFKENRTICVKTHVYKERHLKEFDGAILLIRNPYRAFVAEVFRKRLEEERIHPTDEVVRYFASQEWEDFVEEQTTKWKDTYLSWLRSGRPCLPILYEELERDTTRHLTKMVEFLHRPATPDRILCATQEHPSSLDTGVSLGDHGRSSRVYLTADPFTARMRTNIDQSIREVNETLYELYGKVLCQEYLEPTVIY